jgi:CheY-like chemotaxis protein
MLSLFKRKKTVVIVEDDVPLRVFIVERLEAHGVKVVECGDGSKALQIIAEEQPDCVMLDMMLPGKNGMEILAELREVDTKVPVVVLTTLSGSGGLEDEAVKRNAVFLNKAEASIEEVLDTVLNTMDM